MSADLSSSRPSKPGVVGSSPAGRVGFPSEVASGAGSEKFNSGPDSPDRVPEKSGSKQRHKRSAPSREDIRKEVCERAQGECESCCAWVGLNGEDGHLDHRFGRGAGRPKESVANCWLLCIACDAERTKPTKTSAAYWWAKFIQHAEFHDFTAEAELATTKLESLKAKGLVSL